MYDSLPWPFTPWRISTMGRVRRLTRVSSKRHRRRACRPSSPFPAPLVAVGAGPCAGRVSAYLVLLDRWLYCMLLILNDGLQVKGRGGNASRHDSFLNPG